MRAANELSQEVGVRRACQSLGIPRASFYRARQEPTAGGQMSPRRSPRALTADEQRQVKHVLNSERFMDQAPREVYATLLDEGQYLCSGHTMYRLLEEDEASQERRNQLRHPHYQKPELLATAPNQVWSWDITKLAAKAVYEKRRQRLGLKTLRPWDLDVDPTSRPPLRPYQTIEVLENKTSAIFHQVDPQLGEYFASMQREKLLDLDNRKGKAPGGYCTAYEAAGVPFIFMNAVGLHDDVQTLLHEGGHAFHVFECSHLSHQQMEVPLEFAEVASMGMELLAAPHLTVFYSPADASRAWRTHLENLVGLLCWIATVDAFQHWLYTRPPPDAVPCRRRLGRGGGLTRVVRSQNGFHLFKMLARSEARQASFDDIREPLRRYLEQREIETRYRAYLADLRKRFPVDIKV